MNIEDIEKTRKIYQVGIKDIPKIQKPQEVGILSSFFKNLSNSFSMFSSEESKLEREANQKIADSKLQLENIFSSAFETMNYEKLGKMIDSGYELNDSQRDILTKKINVFIEKENNKSIVSLYNIGLKPSDENMHRMFFDSTTSIHFSEIWAMNEAKKILSPDVFKKFYDASFLAS